MSRRFSIRDDTVHFPYLKRRRVPCIIKAQGELEGLSG